MPQRNLLAAWSPTPSQVLISKAVRFQDASLAPRPGHLLCGGPDRRSSLHTPPNNLGNFKNNSLGGENRQLLSWVSPSPRDLGGDPAAKGLGSKSASSWHLSLIALEECMTTELELQATSHMLPSLESEGQLVLLVDSFNQESLNSFELGKGLVNHEHVKTKGAKQKEPHRACSTTACRQTKEEQKQLDQARLQEGQLRQDLSSQQKLEQENKHNSLVQNNNSLGPNNKSLGPACNNSSLGNNSLGIEEQQGHAEKA